MPSLVDFAKPPKPPMKKGFLGIKKKKSATGKVKQVMPVVPVFKP